MADNDKERITNDKQELEKKLSKLYGDSTDDSTLPKRTYDPSELNDIRKKMFILLIIVVLFVLIAILVYYNPLSGKKTNSISDNNKSVTQNVSVSANEYIYISHLLDWNSTNSIYVNVLPLYAHDVLKMEHAPDDIKMYLVTKSSYFEELLLEYAVNDYVSSCVKTGVSIPKEQLESVSNKVLGSATKINLNEFNTVYTNDNNVFGLHYVLKDEVYIVTCTDLTNIISTDINAFAQQEITNIKKYDNVMEAYQKVVFISYDGKMKVYKDPLLTDLITDDETATVDYYLPKGNTYKFTFIQNGENYYLDEISLVTETN